MAAAQRAASPPANAGFQPVPASPARLGSLCDRVAMSLDAGIDVRRVWRGEASRNRGRLGDACESVAEAIESGQALEEAVAEQAGVFPPLLVEMTRVGEQTGTLTKVYRRLVDHYERRVARGREFRSAIVWPAIQLLLALFVVGVLIGIGGVLSDGRGRPIDLLGFGLVGARGLAIYLNTLLFVALFVVAGWAVAARRPAWGAAVREWLCRVPVVGECFDKLSLARIAWALHLTLNVDMDVRRVAVISLRASDNRRYDRHGDAVVRSIEQGQSLTLAFAHTGVFPGPFLDALMVAEESGQIVESMERLSKRYDEEAEHALAILGRVAAFLVWAAVATLVVLLIFRLFAFYTGVLNDAINAI